MPICPRCGKTLSSDQALTYHLNRKYKCGCWKCACCLADFDTKFALKIHEVSCNTNRKYIYPSYDILCNIYTRSGILFIETDNEDVIHSINPVCEKILGYKQQELIGRRNSDLIMQNEESVVIRKTKEEKIVKLKHYKIMNGLSVEYVI